MPRTALAAWEHCWFIIGKYLYHTRKGTGKNVGRLPFLRPSTSPHLHTNPAFLPSPNSSQFLSLSIKEIPDKALLEQEESPFHRDSRRFQSQRRSLGFHSPNSCLGVAAPVSLCPACLSCHEQMGFVKVPLDSPPDVAGKEELGRIMHKSFLLSLPVELLGAGAEQDP